MPTMRKERVRALNNLVEELKKEKQMQRDDVLRYLMNFAMISKVTAERYVDDLLFMGMLESNKNILKLKAAKV